MKVNTKYKTAVFDWWPILVLAILSLAAVMLSGCSPTDSYRSGIYAGAAARIGFDSESDRELFREIKGRIDVFLESRKTLTGAVVTQFVGEYSDRISPAVIFMVVEDLNLRIFEGEHDEEGRMFLEGLSMALEGI